VKTFFTPSVIRCYITIHNGVCARRRFIEESVYNVYMYICYNFFLYNLFLSTIIVFAIIFKVFS
jgi:hypothetical protein